MKLAPQDTRTASEGSSSGAETQPRAGTEQSLLFTHGEATISSEARQKLNQARETLSVQVGLRKEGSVTDKDVPCPVQIRFERCVPEKDNQIKQQCICCSKIVNGQRDFSSGRHGRRR
jgi:hypothetical protein